MRRMLVAAAKLAAWLGMCALALAAPQEPVRAPTTLRAHATASNPTSELLIFLAPGTDAASFAQDHGLTMVQPLRSDSDAWRLCRVRAPVKKRHCTLFGTGL